MNNLEEIKIGKCFEIITHGPMGAAFSGGFFRIVKVNRSITTISNYGFKSCYKKNAFNAEFFVDSSRSLREITKQEFIKEVRKSYKNSKNGIKASYQEIRKKEKQIDKQFKRALNCT